MALLDYSKLRPDVAKHAKKAEKVILNRVTLKVILKTPANSLNRNWFVVP